MATFDFEQWELYFASGTDSSIAYLKEISQHRHWQKFVEMLTQNF